MKLGIAETLAKVEKAKAKADRVRILQENDTTVLRDIIRMAYDRKLTWMLPQGDPPYKPSDIPGMQPNLYQQWRRIYLFIEGPRQVEMKNAQRESLFIQLLEGIDPADAKLLCAVKDGKMPYAIERDTFKEAFPGLLTFKVAKEKVDEDEKVDG